MANRAMQGRAALKEREAIQGRRVTPEWLDRKVHAALKVRGGQ
ncbi:MAG: hypothetical protein OYI31_07090 [Chloroflexota bacterium]|nr:hypothetical protein [Chloroflexota bacterium]MDE2941040.1 hypothetical protein [Chloroflexota bacterium]MDE3268192.1 hypothetical protein [Chloroflexota bacterium]